MFSKQCKAHLEEVEMTGWQHMKHALGIAFKIIWWIKELSLSLWFILKVSQDYKTLKDMKPTKCKVFCLDCGRSKMLFDTEKKAQTFIKFN